MSIYQPVAIFKAQVNNASAAKGDRTITFDTVTLGAYTAIENGMTMFVGSSPGGQEIGKVRVKSATSTQIVVSENSDIYWRDNLFLTVFRFHELWPVFPRIILNPSNNNDVIFYKDYDIVYSNQNSILGTFVNAGPHRAADLDPASGQARIYYSSTGSYNMLGSSLTYSWFFEGAMVTGSTSIEPGYVTYNTPGHYETRLTINGSAGESDTTYRYVSIYNVANPPIQRWQVDSVQGSRDEGGYTASFKVFEIIPIQEHAIVVLFAENYYGDTLSNLGGNAVNAGDIFYVGYVDKDSIEYDYEHSEVSFSASSITDMMKKSSGFSVSVKSVTTPTKWYELLDMDSRRALYHYLRWHTTALSIADFQFLGTDYKIQYFDSDRESMFDAINNYMQNAMLGKVVSDRQSKAWIEVDARAYINPTGSFTPIMDITARDWMGTPNIEERLTDEIAYLEYGGVAYSGINTGTFSAIIGSAPGEAPGFYGGMDSHEGLALLDQSQLNQLVGNVFANKNSQFPSVGLDMGINASNLDIAPQESLGLHVNREDTVRNLAINGLYIPDSMSWKYNPQDYILLPNIDLKQIVTGDVGQTVTIPSINDIGGGFEVPALELPPLPNFYPPTSADIGDGAPARVLIHDTTYGLLMTNTFNTSSPMWYQINGGLTQTQYQAIDKVVVCPNGAVYVGYVNTASGVDTFLARAPYAGGTFVILEDYTSIQAKYGSTDNIRVAAFNCNRNVGESVLYCLTQGGTNIKTYFGSGVTFIAKATFSLSTDNGADVSYGVNFWMMTGGGNAKILTSDGASVSRSETVGVAFQCSRHARIGLTTNTIHWSDTVLSGGGTAIALGFNNLTTKANQISNELDNLYLYEDKLVCDVTGMYLLARNTSFNATKSSDGGYSWIQVSNLPVLVNWYYACPGDAGRWIAVGGGYVYYTNSFWNSTPTDKRGNLLTLIPLPILNAVKILP
jgi:hypothetical protein